MNSKSLLIAIAAFAVTATGAQAFVSTDYLNRAGLSVTQVDALTQARDLRIKGKSSEARDLLLEAGVNEETLASLRKATHEAKDALHKAILDKDFEAFREAVKGTPLYDLVTTPADFELFCEAHDLKSEGKLTEANKVYTDLGLPEVSPKFGHGKKGGHWHKMDLSQLSPEEASALQAAREANDKELVKQILKEAGVNDYFDADRKGYKNDWQ